MNAARLFASVALVCAAACGPTNGSGVPRTESRTVTDFTRARFGGGLEVTVNEGPLSALVLTGDDNLVPLIDAWVEGGTLVVEPRPDLSLHPVRPLTAAITVPRLDVFAGSGATRATIEAMRGDAVRLEASGASTLVIGTLAAAGVTAVGSGASAIEAKGALTTALSVDLAGASIGRFRELTTDTLVLTLSGASKLTATVTQSVRGTASGASAVTLYGSPVTREITTSGASTVVYSQ